MTRVQRITMAEAVLSDGQRLVAFNDLFIGVRSHVSARYRISHGSRAEEHSSSGIVVSTGAGSTGWLRSVYAGAAGVAEGIGTHIEPRAGRFAWDASELIFVVREPWPSKTTGASVVHGTVTRDAAAGDRIQDGGRRRDFQRRHRDPTTWHSRLG